MSAARIRAEALGELKDGAASLVTLTELLASRRVGPKAIAAALASAGEACESVATAGEALAGEVIAAARDHAAAAAEIRAVFDRAIAGVRALEAEVAGSKGEPGDARTRLVLERVAQAATAQVAASLFVGELFAAATAPRTVSIRVADVLGFVPAIGEGPGVIRATLDVPPGPIVTTDARLLRALVELGVQIVDAAGVEAPHVQVGPGASGGARIRVGVGLAGPASASGTMPASSRRGARETGREPATMGVRRLPWSAQVREVARAAGATAGVSVAVDPSGRGVTIVFG